MRKIYDKKFHGERAALNVRESFNNTVLLMTMVKSEYYYIVSFSRPKNSIVFGFDYATDLHGKVTELVNIDFGKQGKIFFTCKLGNVGKMKKLLKETADRHSGFECEEEFVFYKKSVEVDDLIPVGIKAMDEYITSVKNELCGFLEDYYKRVLHIP